MGPISSTTGSTYTMRGEGIGMVQEEKSGRKRAGKEEVGRRRLGYVVTQIHRGKTLC